jgi:hypothetical protein
VTGGGASLHRDVPLDPDDPVDQALASLEEDLGVRLLPAGTSPPPAKRKVKWDAVYEWCRRHPGKKWEIDGIHANAAYRLRKRHPDLTVDSWNVRKEVGTGRRINTMSCVYHSPYDASRSS